MASRASAAAVRSNLRALRISNHTPSSKNSTGLSSFSTCCAAKTHRPPPLSLSFLPRQQQQRPEPRWQQQQQQQQQQHRSYSATTGRTAPAGLRCLSSIPAVSLEGRPTRLTACCSLSSSARAQHHRCHHHHHHRRHANQPFCTTSSSGNSSSSGPGKLEVEVTHVDGATAKASAAAAAAAAGDGDEREMMPEEDRQPIGAGAGAGAGESGEAGGEENVVRFLDVPGSEQTREEKMTIVFTCTVCETRTAKTFAKLSYERGVVIARCPGCHNLHLIADRLGWFEEAGDGAGGWDIQKITNRIGESDCHVVNEDNVMELNLVDIVGKTTTQKDASPAPEGGDGGSDSPRARGSTETSK